MKTNETIVFNRIDWVICLLISIGAIGYAWWGGFTAYQYNEIDMLPFWERKANPEFLPHDFFTNASASPNSRHIWGNSIHYISRLTGFHWYSVLYVVKLIFVSLIGCLFYLTMISFYKKWIHQETLRFQLITGAFTFLCVSNLYFVQFFTIAWWPPFIPDANAHNIALFFGLLSLIIRSHFISIPLSLFSSLLHPVFGSIFFLLHTLKNFNEKKYTLLLYSFSCIIVPFILHSILFKAKSPLTAKEFVDLYAVYRHPGHYIPSQFGKMGLTSLQVYVIESLLLISAIWYGYTNRNKTMFWLAGLLFLFLNGCIGLQYFLVEKFPIKIVAIVGPSRYLLFMGWGIAFLYGWILATISLPFKKTISKLENLLTQKLTLTIVAGIAVVSFSILLCKKDNPRKEKDSDVLTWMRTETSPHSTFATNNWLVDEMDIRFIGNRAVYAGECFPFNEDFFKEYHQRAVALYGKPEDWLAEKNIVLQRLHFYNRLTPEDFIAAAELFPLDYIIIDIKNMLKFDRFKPSFQNEKVVIYSISELKGGNLHPSPSVAFQK